MPKHILLSITMSFLYCSLIAQVKPSSEELSARQMARLQHRAQTEQVAYKGYLISIQPALAGNYGYDIFNAGNLLISQRRNPFTRSQVGLRSKDDLIKIARWCVNQLNDGTPPGELMNTPLPKNLSRKLNVQVR
ncbi:MAG TPA: hypothetical protein VK616_02785 [Flavitalea sp.]|nr:hypothetical protein [Flavitalea sp.]HTF29661.1 hypothetical protein [Flavitalea sp.]